MLTPVNSREVLGYLEESPAENVFVHWLITSGQLARGGELAVWRDAGGSIRGSCYAGLQLVPAAQEPEALAAFGAWARRVPRPRMIVGARSAVEPVWSRLRAAMPEPSAIRTSQPVYTLTREGLRYSRADADVALVTLDDLDEIVANSALMIAGELGGDPRRTNADFRGRTARIIQAGWWWSYRVGGELAFMCNIGSSMPQIAQIQGVWSPPGMRGHGYAARALGAICDHLLDARPALCLYVNDFNVPALALYERVGFHRSGEFQTVIF
jgi:RimJ/RimL family protein N-acetyltransferase